ncbi:substrate-binding domain-containing protein [Streptomyces sp. 135]|uniref:substrate-binding domain-containing protein n=1 Tax=Streptomyces sp. 135 TaxID=2838850 RepID=UPI0021D86B15|nr:substrate-binding domain-containing protein [Streptomyces sp. 135]
MALGDFSVEWGRAAVDEVWPARPDALVCANDLIAIGALQRLQQLGVTVPGEVAVTGFDDIPMAALSAPGVTTVRQPVPELAAEAARLLALRLSGDNSGPQRSIRLAPALVVRESSTPSRLTPPRRAERDAAPVT